MFLVSLTSPPQQDVVVNLSRESGDKGVTVWRVIGERREQTVEAVPVEVLRFLDGEALITGSLDVKDRLVTAGVHRLVAGMQVEAIERAAKAAL